jgi:hypothetical protein
LALHVDLADMMRRILTSLVLAGMVAAALAGCGRLGRSSSSNFQYNRSPAAAEDEHRTPIYRDRSGTRVVVLGHFRTPQHPLRWSNVGPGMSDALARTLLNHGDFDVWINPNLARRVEMLIDTSADDRQASSLTSDAPIPPSGSW